MKKKNMLKKLTGMLAAVIMTAAFLMSTPVNAASPIQSPYKIDGTYATGSVATYDTSTAKFAAGTTTHKANSTKSVTVTGYYFYNNGIFDHTSPSSNSAYTDPYVTASADCPSNSTPCGAAGSHTVGSWTGYSSIGITSMYNAMEDPVQ